MNWKTLLLFVFFASSTLGAQQPDLGENTALKNLSQVWISFQVLAFKSDLSGTQLTKMKDEDKEEIKRLIDYLWQNTISPELNKAAIHYTAFQPLIEDAEIYYTEHHKKYPDERITRKTIIRKASRENRISPKEREPHLRFFLEIQQDGLEHYATLTLSLIQAVTLQREPTRLFWTTTWSKTQDALLLGLRLDRETLNTAAQNLIDSFNNGRLADE